MDQQLDIYVNVERPSPTQSNRSREKKSSKHIYENVMIGARKPGPAVSGNTQDESMIFVVLFVFR